MKKYAIENKHLMDEVLSLEADIILFKQKAKIEAVEALIKKQALEDELQKVKAENCNTARGTFYKSLSLGRTCHLYSSTWSFSSTLELYDNVII